jgi:hypothetical protein
MKIINIHALDEVQNILDLFHSSAVLLKLKKMIRFLVFWWYNPDRVWNPVRVHNLPSNPE